MTITRKDQRMDVDVIKHCVLSNGYRIYLFRNNKFRNLTGNYIVAVKAAYQRDSIHFLKFYELANAVSAYIEYICRYA